jgi:hypothetical protein
MKLLLSAVAIKAAEHRVPTRLTRTSAFIIVGRRKQREQHAVDKLSKTIHYPK